MEKLISKARHIDTGEWVVGYYVHSGDAELPSLMFTSIDSLWPGCWKAASVDENTLCVYTGVHDASGKSIFSGDMLRHKEYNETCAVVYCHEHAQFRACFLGEHEGTSVALGFDAAQGFEVIGNMYDEEEDIHVAGA